MEIAFINLTHHKKSGSSDWFIKEIKKEFSVGEFTYDSDPSSVLDILDYKPDLVICWQVDFLVPWFASRKVKAISVPMADACENMPNEYFRLSGIYGSISMTSLIYDRMKGVENVVSPLIYAPKPNFEINKKRNIFAFLGVRKEHYELPLKIVERLKRKQLKCHLHNSIDQILPSSKYLNFDSNYFEDKNDLDSILLDSNFYICPREVEGIGLSYIKAMEIGCIPIGSDGHGMHDYINNGISGILFEELNDKSLIKNIDKERYFSSFIDDLININVFEMRATMHHEMTVRNQLMKRQMASVIKHLQKVIDLDEVVISMTARRSLIGLLIDHRRILDGRYVKIMSIISSIISSIIRPFISNNFLQR
jgi:hypothetical protein